MAKDDKKPSATQKGKAKAEEKPQSNGEKSLPIHDKDGKSKEDGDKEEPVVGDDELSEEDKQLKEDLEMLVERLKEDDPDLYKPSIEAIKNYIKTATSSMTAVPKPLKFLRPHYDDLAALYEKWPSGENKDSLADMLSVLGMTYGDEENLQTLKFRLLSKANEDELGSWGHEYIRHLALEIGKDYEKRLEKEEDTQDLTHLALSLVPYFLKHNAEADAVDLLSELEMINELPKFVDADTFSRTCLYMVSMVNLLTYPEDQQFLKTAYDVYMKYEKPAQAMVLAIRLNDTDLVQQTLHATEDPAIQKQLAFMAARQRLSIELDADKIEDVDVLNECLGNAKLSDHFKTLAKELNILEPKTPEDIYKSHLESGRNAAPVADSAKANLANAFVNGFVNAGFSNDKIVLTEDPSQSYIWRTKEDGQTSATASIGLISQWDIESGLDKIDQFQQSSADEVKEGALLSYGILNSGVHTEIDPAGAILADSDNINASRPQVRMASMMGLGLTYAGSANEGMLEHLLPILEDTSLDLSLSAMAAISLGLIFVGTGNDQVAEAITTQMMEEDRQNQLKDKWARFMALGLGLLYFGRQEEVDAALEILKAIEHPTAKPTAILASICAWAGTGAVLKVQELLHICNDHIEDKDDNKDDQLVQSYAVLGLSLISMGEDVGQDMILRQFGHLMHYGEPNIRKVVPLAMGLISVSNPQMKIYDTLSRYSHDNDNDVAINAIFAMGLVGAGTNNARLAQLLRSLASYYHRDQNSLFMVRIAQGLVHMGKGTMTLNPFHTDRQVLSRVSAAGLLTVLVSLIDAKQFILDKAHFMLYYLVTAMFPRFLVTLDEDLQPLTVNVRVGQAVDVVGQAGRPKTITGWQTQSTPVLLAYGERAELEDEQYIALSANLEGLVILRKNPEWEENK